MKNSKEKEVALQILKGIHETNLILKNYDHKKNQEIVYDFAWAEGYFINAKNEYKVESNDFKTFIM
jgi:hypothetical protein